MILLTQLLLAHLIGDFVIQPERWVRNKEVKKHRSPKLYLHVLIHGILTFLLVWDFTFWLPVAIIVFSHLLIDLAKVNFQKPDTRVLWFIADQALHLLIITAVWYAWQHPDISLQRIDSAKLLIIITAVVFLTNPTSVIMKTFISQWTPDTLYTVTTSLPDAGKFIGFLERLFVLIFVLHNHWEAVGFLLAAKSVFRFGNLKESHDRKLTEYVLIGTLLSFGIALSVALLVARLLLVV
jgi:hypothetical protein